MFNKFIKWIAESMYNDIYNKKIKLKPIHYQKRYDNTSGKIRKIGITSIEQQVFDYIAVYSCVDMFLSKIGYYQCASLKNKGQLFGKNAIEKWIKTNPKKTKWVLKMDIKKFYPSVNHDILKKFLARDIKNEDILYVLYTLIDTYEEGLCIGSFLSQYLANYYLSYAYHFISEQIYRVRRGKVNQLATHVLFYMDDMLVLGTSKHNLERVFKHTNKYINDVLNLSIKDNYRLYSLDDDKFIDMMGFKIYRSHTTIRRKTFLRLRSLYMRYKDSTKPMSIDVARTMVSYYGWIKNSNSFKFKTKYKVERTLRRAKEVISSYDKS